MTTQRKPTAANWLRSKNHVALLAFLAIAGFFLITEHTAHVFGVLPYFLLVLCPLLHLFMHRGHGNHTDHSESSSHTNHTESRGQSGGESQQ